jgi:hypothetical protein
MNKARFRRHIEAILPPNATKSFNQDDDGHGPHHEYRVEFDDSDVGAAKQSRFFDQCIVAAKLNELRPCEHRNPDPNHVDFTCGSEIYRYPADYDEKPCVHVIITE